VVGEEREGEGVGSVMQIVQLAAVADGGAEAEAGVGAEARNLGELLVG